MGKLCLGHLNDSCSLLLVWNVGIGKLVGHIDYVSCFWVNKSICLFVLRFTVYVEGNIENETLLVNISG